MDDNRNYLESVAKSIAHCQWFAGDMFGIGLEVTPDLQEIGDSMLSLRDKIHDWLRERPRRPAKDTTDHWAAFCPTCGWAGLSRDCEVGKMAYTRAFDFEDVRCPVCFSVVDDEGRGEKMVKKPPPCPKCGERFNTYMHHDWTTDLYYSRCGKCGHRSNPSRNYSKAWAWKVAE